MPMRPSGFTLLEMMVALLIVAILALMVVPVTHTLGTRQQVKDALTMTDSLKDTIAQQWQNSADFPLDNAAAGLPPADKLIGNYVTGITVEEGALHLTLGNKAHRKLRGRVISLQPLFVPGYPQTPLSWRCGYSPVPPGMQAAGENATDVDSRLLPFECRDTSS